MQISLNFKTSCWNLNFRGLGAKLFAAFLLFYFWKDLWHLKSKSPCILLNENINFNKNAAESKRENPTPSFRETNLVLQLIWESQIKSKTVMSWSSLFVPFILSEGIFFNICVLSQFIVYWIHFQNKHTFTY